MSIAGTTTTDIGKSGIHGKHENQGIIEKWYEKSENHGEYEKTITESIETNPSTDPTNTASEATNASVNTNGETIDEMRGEMTEERNGEKNGENMSVDTNTQEKNNSDVTDVTIVIEMIDIMNTARHDMILVQ